MNKNQQVAAVTQTLAGERLTQTITFPTTGDSDCDLIQGILAIISAIGQSSDRVAIVLRYLAERVEYSAKQHDSHSELANLVRRQETLERHMGALEQQARFYQQGYSSAGFMGGPMGGPINPYTNPSAQQMAGMVASAPDVCPQMGINQVSDEFDKLYAQLQNGKKPKP